MESAKDASRPVIGLSTATFLVLLVLKLGFDKPISWIWVFSPFWIPLLLLCAILAILGIVLIFCD